MAYNFTSAPTNYPQGANTPIKRVKQNRAPTIYDGNNFTPGDEWLDTNANGWWKFVKFSQGVALWEKIGAPTGITETLTGNSGGAVDPDSADNINTLGTGSITVVGNPSTHTLTTQLTGLTNHAVLVGAGSATITNVGPGTSHSVLIGNGAADPSFSTTSTTYFTSVSFDAGTNTLKTYQENISFTPVIQGSMSAGTATYINQHGVYTRIGNVVCFEINLVWTSHTGTGDMQIAGFPYTFAAATSVYPMPTLVQNIALPASTLYVQVSGINNTTTANIPAVIDSSALSNVQMSAAGGVFISGFYLTIP